MPILMDASVFVGVCLVVGLGIFLAVEEARQLQGRHIAVAVREVALVAIGLLMAAAAGAYWLSMAVP